MATRSKVWLFCLAVAGLVGGCYQPNFDGGKLQCDSQRRCPSGYHCATDNTCWKNGTDPTGTMSGADMAMGTTPTSSNAHTGAAVVSGAVTASSQHYKMIMSTGESPGGNGTASSSSHTLRSGVVGATQGSK